jgi:hypothetical protein
MERTVAAADEQGMEQLFEEALAAHPSDEDEQILRWRLDQFRRLGFDLVSSALMAHAPVDLGLARRLIAAGCPVETAGGILL